MNRRIKFVPGGIYHIYNRGVAKCNICEEDADFWRMLQGLCLFNDKNNVNNILWQIERDRGRLTLNVLKDYINKQDTIREPLVRILAYCIMPNHFHLVIAEFEEGGIVKLMHKFGTGYVRYFNKKHNRVGGLFQGRFKAVQVESERQLLYLLIYINVINPGQLIEPNLKEEGIKNIGAVLERAENYPWGTHQEYLGKRNSLIINKRRLIEMLDLDPPQKYRELVENVLRAKKYATINHLLLE